MAWIRLIVGESVAGQGDDDLPGGAGADGALIAGRADSNDKAVASLSIGQDDPGRGAIWIVVGMLGRDEIATARRPR